MASNHLPRPELRQRGFLREIVSAAVFFIAMFTLLQLAMPRSIVHGRSMEPNFAEGQYLVISRVNYLFGDPERGDIVVFNSPAADPDEPSLIKRVIGLPGDSIEFREGETYINGVRLDEPYINEPCFSYQCPSEETPIVLGQDEYFMMGDNRNVSQDSREFGPVPRANIIGEVLVRYWPLDKIGVVHQYQFSDP
jgi:signal peptidase I